MKTFYWHDYETWGADPSVDRASQFAGVRTDEELNIIGEPLVIYAKPAIDVWPHPEACLVTGITPQVARAEGLTEREFISKIHAELAAPNTCGVGYNSIRFDDEVTRYTLYRNYFDPYEREWRYGNSRWDIIDMIRLTYALRPEGIEWPIVDGKPSFRLELLTEANGISHESAHDAYSDVEATIKMAALIKQKKPELYAYVVQNKSKQKIAQFIDTANRKPLLHISSKFSSERGCAGLIAPIAMHPVNRNAVIVYDLSVDPAPMASLSAEEIRDRVFISQADLPEGVERLPIKLVHLNKCPILATPKLLTDAAAVRLGIDKQQCEANWHQLLSMDIADKLQSMYASNPFEPDSDPERRLYDGFVGDEDKRLMAELRKIKPEEFERINFVFEDGRLNDMFIRYKARNFLELLNDTERAFWHEHVRERLLNGSGGSIGRDELLQKISLLTEEHADDQSKLNILNQLQAYCDEVSVQYQLPKVAQLG